MEGHVALVGDLTELLQEATSYEFHDFRNRKYDAPKVALAGRLYEIRQNVINGRYDN